MRIGTAAALSEVFSGVVTEFGADLARVSDGADGISTANLEGVSNGRPRSASFGGHGPRGRGLRAHTRGAVKVCYYRPDYMTPGKFEQATVVSFESRNAKEMARLIEKQNGVALSAPSMREVPLADQTEAFGFGERLLAGEVDCLILLTGVGLRALVSALETRYEQARIVQALAQIPLICRGPKPQLALKEWGLAPKLVAPEPNTTETLVAELDRAAIPLAGQRIEVQEYGERNEELAAALRARGAQVRSVAVYMWQLPEDTAPLEHAITRIAGGGVDVALFTSARQIVHTFEVAERMGLADALLTQFRDSVVLASIGPVTTDALRERGLNADVEPPHPKMGSFVTFVAAEWNRLKAKRSRAN